MPKGLLFSAVPDNPPGLKALGNWFEPTRRRCLSAPLLLYVKLPWPPKWITKEARALSVKPETNPEKP